jgi:hypothetical protein
MDASSEFYRPVVLKMFCDEPYILEANPQECKQIGQRLGLESLKCFLGCYEISQSFETRFEVMGDFKAHVVYKNAQEVFVDKEIHAVFSLTVVKEGSDITLLDNNIYEDVEFLDENEAVDLGEIAVQYLSLALAEEMENDAYSENLEESDKKQPSSPSPFAILERLKT